MNSYRPMLAVAGLLVASFRHRRKRLLPEAPMRRHRLSPGSKRGPARPKPVMQNPLLLAEVRVARMQQGRVV